MLKMLSLAHETSLHSQERWRAPAPRAVNTLIHPGRASRARVLVFSALPSFVLRPSNTVPPTKLQGHELIKRLRATRRAVQDQRHQAQRPRPTSIARSIPGAGVAQRPGFPTSHSQHRCVKCAAPYATSATHRLVPGPRRWLNTHQRRCGNLCACRMGLLLGAALSEQPGGPGRNAARTVVRRRQARLARRGRAHRQALSHLGCSNAERAPLPWLPACRTTSHGIAWHAVRRALAARLNS